MARLRKKDKLVLVGRDDRRFAQFEQLYMRHGDAVRAALDAGYSEKFARAKGYILAQRLRAKFGVCLNAVGVDYVRLAHKLNEKLDAKTVKWNQASKDWDEFVDHTTQLKAAEFAMQALEAIPNGKSDGNTNVGIKVVFQVPRPDRQPPMIEARVE